MENNKKIFFMQIALKEAAKSSERGEVPVGAVIVRSNKILAKSGNMMVRYSNPLMHAEMIVLHKSSEILLNMGLSIRYEKLDLFVTLEPCAMCAQAISLSRINNLYYGTDDPKGGGVRYGSKVFDHKTCHHKPNIYDGIDKEKSENMLKAFFKNIRNKN
jgi:tRNA(adenine34) deaminase